MSVISRVAPVGGHLSEAESAQVIAAAAQAIEPRGKKILVLLPDHTRTCPLPMLTRQLHAALAPAAARLDFLIALGTHPPLSEQQIDRLIGVKQGEREKVFHGSRFFNHRWNDPSALASIGTLPAAQIRRITGGRFEMDVTVTINKLVFDYDTVLVAGPVFPHEVVGFSGGSKYFFPGICGAELLNFFHWLGAVITNPRIIGNKNTPVRTTLEAAADMLLLKKFEKFALSMVVAEHELAGMFFGPVRESWSAAVDLSDKLHITYMDKPFDSVLSRAPEMYDELWTGGKCMYKMESVVADGGELIIFAPHITQLSAAHGKIIEEVGYHTRDFFLAQWDKYKHFPWGVLAHSTHVRGIGTYENGVEKCRIRVTLATGIPESLCRRINLGYRDPASIDIADWQGRESQGRLYVPQAGERLYKLKNPPAWQKLD
jgi:nickel-dependent lactate racemase